MSEPEPVDPDEQTARATNRVVRTLVALGVLGPLLFAGCSTHAETFHLPYVLNDVWLPPEASCLGGWESSEASGYQHTVYVLLPGTKRPSEWLEEIARKSTGLGFHKRSATDYGKRSRARYLGAGVYAFTSAGFRYSFAGPAGRALVRLGPRVAALDWRPDPLHVVDVCSSEGRPYVLEPNSFSCSDLYGCDLDAVVAAVGEVFEQEGD